MDKMTPEYKVMHEKIRAVMKDCVLPEILNKSVCGHRLASMDFKKNSITFKTNQ